MDEAAGFVKPFTSIVSLNPPHTPRRLVWSFYPHFMIVASETQKGDGTGLRSHCWRIRGENGGKSGFSWLQPPEGVTEVRLPRCSSSDSRAPFISLWVQLVRILFISIQNLRSLDAALKILTETD